MGERVSAITEKTALLRGDMNTGIETVRTILSREQGELRVALAQGQEKAGQQLAREFEAMRTVLETKLREMREGNEAKLAEIQRTVNEQLHAAVEKQMTDSFARVIDQFAAVQKAMGDVQAVNDPDRRHQAPVLQCQDARRLGRDAGAGDAGRHPAARRL